MAETWKRHFWRNTATNYLSTIVRMAAGLALFRALFQNLSREEFGYYSLLWSLFGYAILLDFGLGFAVQKVVAQKAAGGDMETVNRLVSTIFWTFTGLAAALLALFAAGQSWFLEWIKVEAASRYEFGRAYHIFFVVMALNFPLALFSEVLRGLHRLDIVNWTAIGSQVLNVALMILALWRHSPFPVIVLISVATTAAPNIACYFLARKMAPGLSLHPRNFRWGEVRGVLSFSLVAYLITFTNLIMLRADQGVVGFTIGVSFVAVYQVGYKAAEMFGLFSKQIQEALSPAAAHLGGDADRSGVCNLLYKSSRFTALVTTPLYALCAAYLDPVIKVLSGLKHVDASTFWVGQALLLATYSSMLTSSCPKRVLVMCGWEKQLLKMSAAEAGANFVLSVALVYPLGVPGVAIGTLIPAVLVGWLWVIPTTAKFTGLGCGALLKEFFQPVFLPAAASLALLGALMTWFPTPDGFAGCAWRGALVFGTALAVGTSCLRNMAGGDAPTPQPATS